MHRAWERVTRFDDDSRAALGAWLVALPVRAAGFVRAHPVACGAAAVLMAAIFALVRARRARRVPPAVRAYRACLRRVRVTPLPSETPRAFLARASLLGLPPRSLERLAEATRAHETARYASRR
jgi:hypothetical protein